MWPLLLDMTKEESLQSLRCLELEAYAGLITALRAQGPLNADKLRVLKDAGVVLNISQDRHKAEVRRAVNDEKLNTIAYHASGQKITSDEWAQEGRRMIPLMPRIAPQTAYSAIADEVADVTSKNNKQLPNPSSTERKRPATITPQSGLSDNSKTMQFRMPDSPKCDDVKKRKLPISVENSSLAQHLMGPPKISRIQQIYRQKTKARQKEQLQLKVKQEQDKQDVPQQLFQQQIQQKLAQKVPVAQANLLNSAQVKVLQNVNSQSLPEEEIECKIEQMVPKIPDLNHLSPQPGCSNENQAPKSKPTIPSTKLSQHITLKNMCSSSPGPSGEKQIKVCTPRKTLTAKSIAAGQKLIVVSNPQTITTSSILQRTLTIPFVKNISVKNFDKFKIVTTNSPNLQLQSLTTASPFPTTSSKHKVVTVRTTPTVKKVIPLSQLQVLNAKGSIKMLPIGGKIVTKSSLHTNTAPVYIVNSGNVQCLTKSTPSTPIMMACKAQDSVDNKSLLVLKNHEVPILSNVVVSDAPVENNVQDSAKSNVLADIMEAVGVMPADSENYADIENQITQHTIQHSVECLGETELAQQCNETKQVDLSELDNETTIQTLEPEDTTETVMNDTYYIVEEKKPDQNLLTQLASEQGTCEIVNVFGGLDPTTGVYSVVSAEETEETDNKSIEPFDNQFVETVALTDVNLND